MNPYKAMVLSACAALVLAATACSKHESPGAETTTPITTIDWNTAGTITGAVHFNGAAPKRIQIDMGQDPACAFAGANYTEQYVVNNGGLENVFVYVKDGLGNRVYPTPGTPVVIDQKGCRYVPHVAAVMAGQPVKFTNSDATMHNVHMEPQVGGNRAVDVSQAPNSGGDERVLAKPELMIPIRCNNHPWMEAFLNVAANPFFAVTGADGHFTIKGLPPGTYTVVADHEKMGEQTATVTVGPKQTAMQDFTYSAAQAAGK